MWKQHSMQYNVKAMQKICSHIRIKSQRDDDPSVMVMQNSIEIETNKNLLEISNRWDCWMCVRVRLSFYLMESSIQSAI